MILEILTKVVPDDIVVKHYERHSWLPTLNETQSSETGAAAIGLHLTGGESR